MPRRFDNVDDFLGVTPRTWQAWTGCYIAALVNRLSTGGFDTIFYSGANGGGTDGQIQLGITDTDDVYFGIGGTSRTLTTTINATPYLIGAGKSTGTTTPVAHFGAAPFTSWTHSNLSGTLANPSTTAQAVVEFGRWNAAADPFDGDFEFVLLLSGNPSSVGNESSNIFESLFKIGPAFLGQIFPTTQGYWWFDGSPVSDPLRDRSLRGLDQTAITGTADVVQDPRMPCLRGTTFNILPGVL